MAVVPENLAPGSVAYMYLLHIYELHLKQRQM